MQKYSNLSFSGKTILTGLSGSPSRGERSGPRRGMKPGHEDIKEIPRSQCYVAQWGLGNLLTEKLLVAGSIHGPSQNHLVLDR